MSYSWFCSAYDTDDWGMRLATAVQMVGVLVIALGLGAMFHGMKSWHVDNMVMVMGYVIMRVSMVVLWLRAAHADQSRRRTLKQFAYALLGIQLCWIVLAAAHPHLIAIRTRGMPCGSA